MLQPSGRDNSLFMIYAVGRGVDHENLAQPEELKKFFYAKTNRHDIEFLELPWLSHFRYYRRAAARDCGDAVANYGAV